VLGVWDLIDSIPPVDSHIEERLALGLAPYNHQNGWRKFRKK
jgi:hypothetical protein